MVVLIELRFFCVLYTADIAQYYTIDSRHTYTELEISNIFDPSAPRLGLLDLMEEIDIDMNPCNL